jgi:hypothetical protein
VYKEKMISFEDSYSADRNDITKLLAYELAKKPNLKVSYIAFCEFLKYDENNELMETCDIPMRTSAHSIRNMVDVRDFLRHTNAVIGGRIQDFIENGSSWVLGEVLYSELEIGQCRSLNGACGVLDVSSPSDILKMSYDKNSLKNGLCFVQAVAFHFVRSRSEKKINKFISQKINLGDLEFPLDICDIEKFIKLNKKLNISINLIETNDDCSEFFPRYCSKLNKENETVNILWYKTALKVGGNAIYHYAYISNLSRLMRRRWGKSYQNIVFCGNCLSSFYSPHLLRSHQEDCYQHKTEKIEMPLEGNNILRFKNFKKKFPINLIGFYDFESILKPVSYTCDNCEKKKLKKCTHKTVKENKHIPSTYSFIILNYKYEIVKRKTYTGEDCVQNFVNELLDIEAEMLELMRIHVPINMSPDDERIHEKATHCHICEKSFNGPDVRDEAEERIRKVRDHSHLDGEFLLL